MIVTNIDLLIPFSNSSLCLPFNFINAESVHQCASYDLRTDGELDQVNQNADILKGFFAEDKSPEKGRVLFHTAGVSNDVVALLRVILGPKYMNRWVLFYLIRQEVYTYLSG